jgi:hypothetical protein
MKLRFVDDVEEGDALSYASTASERRDEYSEWHHFTVNDDANGLYAIFNLALSGNVLDPAAARAGVSLAVYERGRGWHGTMNLHPFEATRFAPGGVDLAIGGNRVVFQRNQYLVSGALKDGSVVLDATWAPRTSGLRVDRIGDVVNTFIVPSLTVTGTLRLHGREYRLDGASGYHDHNWGHWHWGTGLAWSWGYVIQTPRGSRKKKAEPLSIVFGHVTNGAHGARRSNHALAVWSGARCMQIFLDDAVGVTTAGALRGTQVPRIPGVMALLAPGEPEIPGEVAIHARDGDDWVEIGLSVAGAMQFLIPRFGGVGTTTITELVGQYTVRTMLNGRADDFSYNGFAEIAG